MTGLMFIIILLLFLFLFLLGVLEHGSRGLVQKAGSSTTLGHFVMISEKLRVCGVRKQVQRSSESVTRSVTWVTNFLEYTCSQAALFQVTSSHCCS